MAGDDVLDGVEAALLDACAWVTGALLGTAPLPTEADVVARLHPTFVEAVPPDQVLAVMTRMRATASGAPVTPPATRGTGATFTIESAAGTDVSLSIEAAAPHRITGLLLKPAANVSAEATEHAAAASRWLLEALTARAPEPTVADVTRLVAPSTLDLLAADAILGDIVSSRATLAGAAVLHEGAAGLLGSFLLGPADDDRVAGLVHVEAQPPHRIVGLRWTKEGGDVGPVAPVASAHRSGSSRLPEDVRPALEELVTELATATGAPGVVLAVARDGEIVHVDGRGVAFLGAAAAPDEHTPWRIGSISKIVTALAVLRRVRAGTMDLDQPVTAYLHDVDIRPLPGATAPTLRHLLTQTSGLQRDLPGVRTADGDLRSLLTAGLDAVAVPGTVEQYSNVGFGLLGLALEAVTGRPYAELAAEEVPGATAPQGAPPSPPAATGYVVDAGLARPADHQQIPELAAGAVVATPAQLLALGLRMCDDPDLGTEQDLPGRHGLAVVLGAFDDHRFLFHNGGLNGWHASLFAFPAERLVVASVVNVADGPADELTAKAAKLLLRA
jgi:CubicO group peptidase (beta-lactamase class C family)